MALKLNLFRNFFHSEKAGGFVLIGCTVVSLIIANSIWGEGYLHFWHSHLDLSFLNISLDYSIEHWINDGLMAIFFLLVGLEIERELYIGELSSFKNALLPIAAAIGGMAVPALIHYGFNAGTETVSGFGIPMATDIAFAIGILSLAGKRIPLSLKIFLTALAIIDDLGAITVIAIFYTEDLSLTYLLSSLGVFLLLFILGKTKVYHLWIYIIGGIIMWYLMLKSGVHSTIAGVLLAFAIPFNKEDNNSLSYKLQNALHLPVAFVVLPLFALANTAIVLPENLSAGFTNNNSLGIMTGLLLGKTVGILLSCFLMVKAGWSLLPHRTTWKLLFGVSLLAGIGFTMSIFITNLAFSDPAIITNSKMSILAASVIAALSGLMVLRSSPKKQPPNRKSD